MAGHDEGIIAYGAEIDSVKQLIVSTFLEIKQRA